MTAFAGAAAAAVTALISKYKKKSRSRSEAAEEISSEEDSDNLDNIDFASINNDTPREYVSISINTRRQTEA